MMMPIILIAIASFSPIHGCCTFIFLGEPALLKDLVTEYDDREGQPETSSKYQRTIQMTSGVIKRGWKAVFIGKNLKDEMVASSPFSDSQSTDFFWFVLVRIPLLEFIVSHPTTRIHCIFNIYVYIYIPIISI